MHFMPALRRCPTPVILHFMHQKHINAHLLGSFDHQKNEQKTFTGKELTGIWT
jgi:hypothetical protein